MKKLLVLSVLLGLMALPMFASDITFGGDATFGFIGDFGDNYDEVIDLTLDVNAAIDDYNSLAMSLDSLEGVYALDKALVTTDVGTWLDLPIGFVVTWGFDDPDANEFGDVTEYGNQVYDFSPTAYWGMGFLLSYQGMFEVELAFDPGLASTAPGRLLAGLALKEPIPGLNAEVYYFQNEAVDAFDLGSIGVGAAYATEVADISLEVGANFEYVLDDTALVAWAYTVGVAVDYSMFNVSAAVAGMEDEAFGAMQAAAIVSPVEQADIYAGMVLSFVDGTDTFQGADLGINPHLGAVEMYLGYWITENGAGDLNAISELPLLDGGMYIKFDVDY